MFWVAVTNIYGFFADCSGYIRHDFLYLLKQKNLLRNNEFKKIKNFISVVEHMRAIFCHNMSNESPQAEEHLEAFTSFIKENLQREVSPIVIPYQFTLENSDWELLVINLIDEFHDCLLILDKSVTGITKRPDKEDIINEWIGFIVKWYENSLIFQLAARSYYGFLSLIDAVNYPSDSFQKKEWIQDQKKKWRENGISYVKSQKKPIFPYQILVDFFHDVANITSAM